MQQMLLHRHFRLSDRTGEPGRHLEARGRMTWPGSPGTFPAVGCVGLGSLPSPRGAGGPAGAEESKGSCFPRRTQETACSHLGSPGATLSLGLALASQDGPSALALWGQAIVIETVKTPVQPHHQSVGDPDSGSRRNSSSLFFSEAPGLGKEVKGTNGRL